jgi:hypothetical protein
MYMRNKLYQFKTARGSSVNGQCGRKDTENRSKGKRLLRRTFACKRTAPTGQQTAVHDRNFLNVCVIHRVQHWDWSVSVASRRKLAAESERNKTNLITQFTVQALFSWQDCVPTAHSQTLPSCYLSLVATNWHQFSLLRQFRSVRTAFEHLGVRKMSDDVGRYGVSHLQVTQTGNVLLKYPGFLLYGR